MMQNALKSQERQIIWIVKAFEIEIQKVGANNSAVLQNFFPPKKLGSPSLSFGNSKSLRKVLLNHTECIEI